MRDFKKNIEPIFKIDKIIKHEESLTNEDLRRVSGATTTEGNITPYREFGDRKRTLVENSGNLNLF